MEKVSLSNQLLVDVLNYLANKPWIETNALITRIDEEIKKAKEE